jgi:GNAT superfamily N-acetyltransferase
MIAVYACDQDHAPELARMNRMLIEDERAENDMTIPQLEARMRGFLAGDYRAFFFESGGERVGYALVNPSASPVYLRQFFICRERRRGGLGRGAFHALLAHLDVETIDIDVYVWNEAGRAFWQSLGFQARAISMRYRR